MIDLKLQLDDLEDCIMQLAAAIQVLDEQIRLLNEAGILRSKGGQALAKAITINQTEIDRLKAFVDFPDDSKMNREANA